jgi:hypothetical protein
LRPVALAAHCGPGRSTRDRCTPNSGQCLQSMHQKAFLPPFRCTQTAVYHPDAVPGQPHFTPLRRGDIMNKKHLLIVLSAFVIGGTGPACAAEFGTAAEAKAMLDKAVAEVKKDKAAALAKFAKGEDGFKDRDLYPFCGGPDGNFTAHPSLTGKSLKDLKDKAGKALGEEMYKVAQEGAMSEVSYMWPRPGTTDPVQKVSYVTKVGDQVCAVGFYK